MSEYESNDMDIEYGEPEEQNEEENEEENYQGEENNSNYNENNNNNNNKNYSNKNYINYNNKRKNNNNQNNINENEEEEQDNNSNNISSKKSKNNNNKNTSRSNTNNNRNNKKNSYGGSTMSHENNTLKNEKEENIEENGESPEILYEEFFNYFLPSKKHTLNIKECKNAMRCLGLVVTEREIQEFLGIKEKTGKEKINLEEFKSVCDKKFNESNNNLVELKEAFEMLDPERTGIVDSKVLRHQMKVFKPKITEEEVNQILSEFGEDKNGNINYREYLRNIKV